MRPRAIVWSLTAVTAALAVATSVFAVADDGTRLPAAEGGEVDALGELMFTVMVLAFGSLGALIAARRPAQPDRLDPRRVPVRARRWRPRARVVQELGRRLRAGIGGERVHVTMSGRGATRMRA
jgi:hypothetical protein